MKEIGRVLRGWRRLKDGDLKEKVNYCSDRDDELKEQPSPPSPAFKAIRPPFPLTIKFAVIIPVCFYLPIYLASLI
jgi:hypothetical protein